MAKTSFLRSLIAVTAFLAAVTQAPITAFIIVMEMVDGHAMVLSLMAAALMASLMSRWISVPIYHRLAQAQLRRLEPAAAPVTPAPGPVAEAEAEAEAEPEPVEVAPTPQPQPRP